MWLRALFQLTSTDRSGGQRMFPLSLELRIIDHFRYLLSARREWYTIEMKYRGFLSLIRMGCKTTRERNGYNEIRLSYMSLWALILKIVSARIGDSGRQLEMGGKSRQGVLHGI